MLTRTTAGGAANAPAAFSSTTAEGAGNGVPFEALLDEEAGADEDLCPHIVEAHAGLGCERTGETARMAPGSSPSATGFYVPFSFDLAVPATEVFSDTPAADEDDEASEEGRLDIVALPFAGTPTLADLLVKAEAGAEGHAHVSAPLSEQGVAPGPQGANDRADVSAEPLATTDVADLFAKAAAGTPQADASRPVEIPDDLRQLAQAALRARIAEAYQQSAPASANASQDAAATLASDAMLRPPRQENPSGSDLASLARAILAEATAQAAGGDTSAGTPSDPDSGAGGQPFKTAGDYDALLGARTVPAAQPLAPFNSMLAAAATPQDAAARAATIPNEAHVASSIVQSMRLQMRDGVGTAVVHLEPDYLGPVTINLRVSGGAVTASLHAENPQVRAWIEANEPMLRQALSDQGLSLDRLLVTAERASEDQEAGPQGRQQSRDEPPPRRQPKADESRTFEVIV